MADGSGNNKGFPFQLLFSAASVPGFRSIRGRAFLKTDLRKKILKHCPVLLLFKPTGDSFRHHVPHARHFLQFLFPGMTHPLQILIKGLADHSCVRDAHIRNSQGKQKPRQGCRTGIFYTLFQILTGLFSESFHLHDLIPVLFQTEEIAEPVDESPADQFLEGHLGQAVYIHGIPRHKLREGFDLFSRTVRILTDQSLGPKRVVNRDRHAAGGTAVRKRKRIGLRQVLLDLGNNHIRLVDRDRIADSKLQGS